MADRFASPFEMPTPPGAEGWQDLYAYSSVFSEDRREYEESAFWFMDGVHSPEAIPPWDATIVEYALIALSQYNTRHYVIPPALGVDLRFLNGYMYLSPVGVTDPEEIGARVPEFAERAGYYFQNWDRLYAAWMPKVRALIGELEAISFEPLPHREDMAVITEGRGTGSALDLLSTYHRLVDLTLKLWHYHFEFLNLGYAAYLDFFGCCKQLFPSIPDQAIAKMVAGIQVDLFQPDEEIKKLARLAVELGIASVFAGSEPAVEVLDGLRGDPQGDKWLAAWEEAKQPWFNFSAGTAFYHSDKVWLEHLDIPLGFLRTYIAKVQRGETLERPMEAVIAERDRIVEEYGELIDSDEDRATFQAKLGLARTVFPYVENHNFYVEHWAHSVIWRKMRDLGRVLVAAGFFADPDDVFLLSLARGARGAVRPVPRLGGRRAVTRAEVLAAGDDPPQRHHERAAAMVAAAGPGRAARGHHRAVYHHALGHHLGQRPAVARRRLRVGRPGRLRGLPRRGRGTGAGHPVRGRDRRAARGRDPGRADDRAELGAGVRQDRGDGDRRGRDHEPRRDRVP